MNAEFIGYLLDLLINYEESRLIDFPQTFYRKLLRF